MNNYQKTGEQNKMAQVNQAFPHELNAEASEYEKQHVTANKRHFVKQYQQVAVM